MTKSKPHYGRSRLLSVDQVADELGVSTKTVRRQIAAGELISTRVGRCLRVAEDDLATYRQLRRGRAF